MRARFEILIGFHPRTIHFLQLFLILLPHLKSVFACDSIMLPVRTSTRALVEVDIIVDELVRLDLVGNQFDSVDNQRGFIGIDEDLFAYHHIHHSVRRIFILFVCPYQISNIEFIADLQALSTLLCKERSACVTNYSLL